MYLHDIIQRSNMALDINQPTANRHLSTHGSDWLWAVTALFTLMFLSWLIWSFVLKGSGQSTGKTANEAAVHTTSTLGPERIFHYLWVIAAFAGMIAYFTMASDLGNTTVRQSMHHGNNYNQTRQIFYVRYIYWFVAWPMLVIATLLLSGVSWATIIFAVTIQEFWVVSWLAGALIPTSYKWGYYVFGIFAYFVLAAILLSWGRSHSVRIASKHYTPLTGALVFIWMLYIIAWGLSEGSNKISVTGEMIFYGILDLITVPILGFAFLSLSRSWDHGNLGLHYTQGRVGGYNPVGSGVGGGPHTGVHQDVQDDGVHDNITTTTAAPHTAAPAV